MLCILSCRNHVRLYSFLPVDPHGWSCTDTLRFELPGDTIASFNTYSLCARFSEKVAYRGLWLVLEQRATPAESLQQPPSPRRDTLYLPLAHENGKWEANGVIAPKTPLTLLVYHIMPKQEISGVLEIGLKVE